MAIKSVFIVDVDIGVTKFFKKAGFSIAETEEEADAAVFTGGADIHPFLYGETPIPGCHFNLKRDLAEIKMFKKLLPSMPKIGICRGAQLLNILSGGTMYQDVDGHVGKDCVHPVKDFVSGSTVILNSVHHQMMIPGENSFIVACARAATVKRTQALTITYSQALTRQWDDPEVVYYQNFNCLCYQGHPELDTEEAQKYFFSLIKTYLGGQA